MISLIQILNEIEIDILPSKKMWDNVIDSIKAIPRDVKDPVVKYRANLIVKRILNQYGQRYNGWSLETWTHFFKTGPGADGHKKYFKIGLEKLKEARKELLELIQDENKITPVSKSIKGIQSEPLNVKIGKYDVNKGEKGTEWTWEDALSNNQVISNATRERCLKIFNKLGITPTKVYRSSTIPNGSTYILGYYNDEPIILAQRQVVYQGGNASAGQFYMYSRYKKSGKNARLGSDNNGPRVDGPNVTKEQILNFLKIPN